MKYYLRFQKMPCPAGRLLVLITLPLLICALYMGCTTGKVYPWPREGGPVNSGKFRAVALTDLDNDGFLDAAAGGTAPESLMLSFGDGRGGIAKTQLLPVKGDVQSIAVADINQDGYHDILFSAQRGASGLRLWLNQSDRKWTRGTGPTEINNYQGLEVGDINGDGKLDVAAANATSETLGGIQVWLGDGEGNWPVETGPTITGVYMDVVLADFNEDGFLDLAGAGWGIGGAVKVWLGDGKGGWSSTPELSKGSYYGLRAGDINGDGHLDVLAATYRNGIHVFWGNGRGSFIKGRGPVDLGSFWDVLLIDLNDDKRPDILAGSIDNGGIYAWRTGLGSSWHRINGQFPDSGSFYEMATGDMNQDGLDDICAASYGEGIRFWRGKGDYQTPSEETSEPLMPEAESMEADSGVIEENQVYTTIAGFPEYKVGPGDILEITLWQGAEPLKENVLIKPNGKISFGFVDDLPVKDLTLTQLDEKLTEYLKGYVKQPRLDVVVKEYNSKFLTITGAVGHGVRSDAVSSGTGQYRLTGKISLMEMLARAGGPTRDANLKEVRIRRINGQTITMDLYRAIFQGDLSQDLILDNGDIVYIPTMIQDANQVYVFGEVAKPGAYSFTGSGMRLFDAVSRAGGPTIFSTPKSTKVIRGDITRPEVISADLQRLVEQGDQSQNVLLANRDLIYVPRSFLGDINLFMKRIKPLLELVLAPAKIVKDYDDVDEILDDE